MCIICFFIRQLLNHHWQGVFSEREKNADKIWWMTPGPCFTSIFCRVDNFISRRYLFQFRWPPVNHRNYPETTWNISNQNILYKTCPVSTPSRHPGQPGVWDCFDILIKEDGRLDWTLRGPQWTSKIKVENKQDDREGDNHVDKVYKDNDEDVNDMTDFESLIHRGDIWMKRKREREGWGIEDDIFLREILSRVGLKDEIYFLLSPFMKDRC